MSAARRGQALIIAVLVLFAVATLAALFVAIISSQIAQVSRHSDVVELRNIAEAGLRLANEQLTFSMYGADWRPSPIPYRCGSGQVTVRVSYGPSPERIQSRFLRIVSSAVLPDNPFLRHTIVALKPVLLTDYARFITDRYDTYQAASLGVTGLELGGGARPADYLYQIDGPIRANTDLVWYGQSRVDLHTTFEAGWSDLGLLRDDRIEVAGEMRPEPTRSGIDYVGLWIDGVQRMGDLFTPQTEAEGADYDAGFARYTAQGEVIPNSRAVLADLPPGGTATGAWLSVPRARPPEIDATRPDLETSRYLLLTRESGRWVPLGAEDAGYNTGEFGWGWTNFGGVYIDNWSDIQYAHDLEKLRQNWMRSVGDHREWGGDKRSDPDASNRPPAGPADWWDAAGRYYTPPAVEIVLHGEAVCPYIDIIRYDDPDGDGFYWRNAGGEPDDNEPYAPLPGMCAPQGAEGPMGILDSQTMRVPFPANGVIYAEGNVRVRGPLPPVRDMEGRRGVDIPADAVPAGYFGEWQAGSNKGRSRRFDLQIVSGGTIYVEGDILTPRGAGMIPDDLAADMIYGTRVALLARDYVCVNTTALNPRPLNAFKAVPDDPANPEQYYYYNDGQPRYSTSGNWGHMLFQGPEYDYALWDAEGAPPLPTEPPGIEMDYRNARLGLPVLRDAISDLRLMLGQSGWHVTGGVEQPPDATDPEPRMGETGDVPDEPWVDVGFSVANDFGTSTWSWAAGNSRYRFRRSDKFDPSADESAHWYADGDPLAVDSGDDWIEPLPDAFQPMLPGAGSLLDWLTGEDAISFTSRVSPVRLYELVEGNWVLVGWDTPPTDLGYLLGPVAIAPPNRDADGELVDALPVQVEALIYAQNGSWFVIPGRWFNDDPDSTLDYPPTSQHPGYHEPLNIRISVYGAICENMPADLGSVAGWTSRWGGPLGAGDGGFLSYTFDPLLRTPRWETADRVGHLRFPRFPLTSDVVIWGERIAGPVGG